MKKITAARRNTFSDRCFDKKIPNSNEASCFIAIIVHSISIVSVFFQLIQSTDIYKLSYEVYTVVTFFTKINQKYIFLIKNIFYL